MRCIVTPLNLFPNFMTMLSKLSNIKLMSLALLLFVGIVVLKVYDQSATDWHFISQNTHLESMKYEKQQLNAGTPVINSNPQTWKEIYYFLPSFSSFTATRQDDGWYIDGQKTDSARTWKFLNELKYVEASGLFSGVPISTLVVPDYKLKITDEKGDSIVVNCFVRASNLVVTSSLAPGKIFDGRVDSLFEQVYVGKARFFPKQEN